MDKPSAGGAGSGREPVSAQDFDRAVKALLDTMRLIEQRVQALETWRDHITRRPPPGVSL